MFAAGGGSFLVTIHVRKSLPLFVDSMLPATRAHGEVHVLVQVATKRLTSAQQP